MPEIQVGDVFRHEELQLELTVWAVGRRVYLTSRHGLPFAVELPELKQQIKNGEWTLIGKEKQP